MYKYICKRKLSCFSFLILYDGHLARPKHVYLEMETQNFYNTADIRCYTTLHWKKYNNMYAHVDTFMNKFTCNLFSFFSYSFVLCLCKFTAMLYEHFPTIHIFFKKRKHQAIYIAMNVCRVVDCT